MTDTYTIIVKRTDVTKREAQNTVDWLNEDPNTRAGLASNALAKLVGNIAPRAVKLNRLVDEYNDWRAERADLSAAEGEGDYPDPDDWHESDDAGCDLLARIVTILNRVNLPGGVR